MHKQILEKLNKELELKIQEQNSLILAKDNKINLLEDKIIIHIQKENIHTFRIGELSKENKKLQTNLKIGKFLVIGASGLATYFFIKSL